MVHTEPAGFCVRTAVLKKTGDALDRAGRVCRTIAAVAATAASVGDESRSSALPRHVKHPAPWIMVLPEHLQESLIAASSAQNGSASRDQLPDENLLAEVPISTNCSQLIRHDYG